MHRKLPPAPPGLELDVERIQIASRMRDSATPYAEMERIRQASMRRNQKSEVHAALLCQSGWYVHWAEGPTVALRELVDRLGHDRRHHGLRVVHHSWGKRYLLTRWSMMLHPSTEPPELFGQRVQEVAAALEMGRQFSPTSVLRRLSAPLRLRPKGSADDPESFHRVGVCAAEEGRSFDLVRWLADRNGRLAHNRRMAGEQDLDSATNYVEFMQDGHPCRVIAVSRAGLQHGLRRAFLPDWPHLLLLFGTDANRNTQLIERVRNACLHLPAMPDLLGVAPETTVHERMEAFARATGLRYRPLGVVATDQHDDIWHLVRDRLKEVGPPPGSQWDLTHPSWLPTQ